MIGYLIAIGIIAVAAMIALRASLPPRRPTPDQAAPPAEPPTVKPEPPEASPVDVALEAATPPPADILPPAPAGAVRDPFRPVGVAPPGAGAETLDVPGIKPEPGAVREDTSAAPASAAVTAPPLQEILPADGAAMEDDRAFALSDAIWEEIRSEIRPRRARSTARLAALIAVIGLGVGVVLLALFRALVLLLTKFASGS